MSSQLQNGGSASLVHYQHVLTPGYVGRSRITSTSRSGFPTTNYAQINDSRGHETCEIVGVNESGPMYVRELIWGASAALAAPYFLRLVDKSVETLGMNYYKMV
ncbi:hypothetical protein N7447_010510 [Penicillium robsamsonii]|uniref:uncharacterized protein n=1 Tax=Penicillium robsamsonii TaxID=1792511 RepID=UPI002546DC20|nr:uncharacterized protein N7447_010510 [Penicillium robsamsonii]KAJ5810994.1 hypothetical protein N7447_010510 [Penicillium robsamsonii]